MGEAELRWLVRAATKLSRLLGLDQAWRVSGTSRRIPEVNAKPPDSPILSSFWRSHRFARPVTVSKLGFHGAGATNSAETDVFLVLMFGPRAK